MNVTFPQKKIGWTKKKHEFDSMHDLCFVWHSDETETKEKSETMFNKYIFFNLKWMNIESLADPGSNNFAELQVLNYEI